MRDQLNSNPLVQMAVIAVLLVAAAVFVFTTMGGGEEEEADSGAISVTAGPAGEVPAPSPTPSTGSATPTAPSVAGAAPTLATRPLPQPVVDAWNANQTVVLVIVHDGGIDDDLLKLASGSLGGMSGVTSFVVPASEIARYASITEGAGVDRVPALVVLGPKKVDGGVPTASVSYGFQNAESIVQAVIDAGYKGPTVEYHP